MGPHHRQAGATTKPVESSIDRSGEAMSDQSPGMVISGLSEDDHDVSRAYTSRALSQMLLQRRLDHLLRLRAQELVDQLPALEDEHHGDAARVEPRRRH